jgi:hypothetical protein
MPAGSVRAADWSAIAHDLFAENRDLYPRRRWWGLLAQHLVAVFRKPGETFQTSLRETA